jgi:hypothetical protein
MVFLKIRDFIYKICRIKSSGKYSNKTDQEIISENFYGISPMYYYNSHGSDNIRPRALSPASVFTKRVTWEDELASIGTFSPHFGDNNVHRTPTPVPLPQDIEKLIIIDIIDSIIDEVEVQAEDSY